MNNSRTSFGIILLVVIPAAVWAVPRLDDFTSSSSLSPLTASFPELQPSDRLRECRQQMVKTDSALNTVRESLFEVEQKLSKLELDQQKLPLAIRELESRIVEYQVEMVEVGDQLFVAQSQLRERESHVRQESDEFHIAAEASKKSEIVNSFNAIDQASKERDRQRQVIGALPSTQDEYLHRRREKRKATASAERDYHSLIAYHQQVLQSGSHPFRNRVNLLKRQIAELNENCESTSEQLDEYRKQHSKVAGLIALESKRRDQLELKLAGLGKQQQIHSEALNIALLDFEDSKRQIAATKAKESIKPSSLVSVSTQKKPTVWISTSRFRPNYSASRLNEPSDVPPVTIQYVSGYMKSNGTYVQGHYRTRADASRSNNWSSKGNVNPFTGNKGYKKPF